MSVAGACVFSVTGEGAAFFSTVVVLVVVTVQVVQVEVEQLLLHEEQLPPLRPPSRENKPGRHPACASTATAPDKAKAHAKKANFLTKHSLFLRIPCAQEYYHDQ